MDKQGTWQTDGALLALRLMLGVVFVFHGAQKLFGAFGGPGIEGFAAYNESLGIPMPLLGAWLAASTEFFGGLALLAGVALRWVSVPLVITMGMAFFVAHGMAFDSQQGGGEYALTLAVVTGALGLLGPGRYTVATLFQKQTDKTADDSASAA